MAGYCLGSRSECYMSIAVAASVRRRVSRRILSDYSAECKSEYM